MPVAQYQIHNTSKDVRTKTQRVTAAGNPKTRLFLAGGSIQVLRQRPYPATEALIRRLAPELLKYEQRGFCKVTDYLGARVDLNSFVAADPVATKPAPTPSPAPPAQSPVVQPPAPELPPAVVVPVVEEPPAPVAEPVVEEPVVEEPVQSEEAIPVAEEASTEVSADEPAGVAASTTNEVDESLTAAPADPVASFGGKKNKNRR
jgi:outer membrane biosynthesis protein TonB